MLRIRSSLTLLSMLITMGGLPAAHAGDAEDLFNRFKRTVESNSAGKKSNEAVATGSTAATTEVGWTPFDGEIRDGRKFDRETIGKFLDWARKRYASVSCAGKPDNRYASSHDIQGVKLGDVCNLDSQTRAAFMSSLDDNMWRLVRDKRMTPDGQLVGASMGVTVEDYSVLGFSFAYETLVIEAKSTESDFIAVIATPYVDEPRAYLVAFSRWFCGESDANSLDPGNNFTKALFEKYGEPTETTRSDAYGLSPGDKNRLMYLNSEIGAMKKNLNAYRADDKGKDSMKARLAEIEQSKQAVLDEIKSKATVELHKWVYDKETLIVAKSGTCSGKIPRFQMVLYAEGSKDSYGLSILKPMQDEVVAQFKKARERRANAPIPKF